MKLSELTEEQRFKICDYFLKDLYDMKEINKACAKCPFSMSIDDTDWRECCEGFFKKELPKKLEKIL